VEKKYFTGEPRPYTNKAGKVATEYVGQRIELNALSAYPAKFIEYIERKMEEYGVAKKLVPPPEVITAEAQKRRVEILRQQVQLRYDEATGRDAKVEAVTQKLLANIGIDDAPSSVGSWAESTPAEPWTKHVADVLSSRVQDIDDDILREVRGLA
jgi:hypothetical protein